MPEIRGGSGKHSQHVPTNCVPTCGLLYSMYSAGKTGCNRELLASRRFVGWPHSVQSQGAARKPMHSHLPARNEARYLSEPCFSLIRSLTRDHSICKVDDKRLVLILRHLPLGDTSVIVIWKEHGMRAVAALTQYDQSPGSGIPGSRLDYESGWDSR